MSRNPHASALRHHKQQIVPDKRERGRTLSDMRTADEILASIEAYEREGG